MAGHPHSQQVSCGGRPMFIIAAVMDRNLTFLFALVCGVSVGMRVGSVVTVGP